MKKESEHFVTCGQMKILERRADEDGLSYYQMMENAGSAAASAIMETVAYRDTIGSGAAVADGHADFSAAPSHSASVTAPVEDGRNVIVFCGKGNNGGDGFVVARLMSLQGYRVTVILVDGKPVTEDAIKNFELLRELPVVIADMKGDERALMNMKWRPDIIVDAIYGTGFRGSLAGNGLRAAIYMNKFAAEKAAASSVSPDGGCEASGIPLTSPSAAFADSPLIFSLDIPSGLGGDLTEEKEMETRSVRADVTVTFHARKPVHLQRFAAPYCGRIIVADIGIDEERLWNVL